MIAAVLGLIAVGVGSIAYEDGQAKRATVIDGGTLDGPVVAPPASSRDAPVAYPTKADVVAAMVEPDPAVRVVEGNP